ncbi:restriction endonuclease subunit S [Enterococcus faecium]|uniref:restriction endonuclease subunit S n=1 Tax=Enterococcus faecium TaxID=1352 RepID=UPI0009BFDE51|nr:restriction endonuclease subunit S [Enterococcus faecium]EGP5135279.1 restriction endonuclease subunit S [Enterococcus faecium]EMF0339015.1 restriction endonuclease subunit S [Enterococcus faecium]EMF0354323.1 restriction endonuclease subunit S [Enterococcus faecium]OQO62395.1 restriction endonuclease subunit S [Enterococcus faecium]
MSNDTLPEIRFPEFTDEWEQRKLGDESDVRDGTHDSPKYYDKGYPLVTSKNLKDFGLDLSNVSFISDEDFEVINKRSKVDIGDILFGMIGTIGNPVLVDRADFAIKNVALIKEQKKILNSFLIQILKSPVFDKYIKNENAGGTQKFLSLSKVRDFNFLCPNIDEQNCISAFFKKLDDTIALHQRKLDLLKETKKGFLQKMFPKNGAKVPEIRFPGFTEDWEQRKFGLLFEKNLEKNKNSEFDASRTISIATMHFKEEGNGAAESSLATYKVLRVGDIAYEGHTSKQFAFGRFVLNDIGDGIMSPRFTTLRPTSERPISFWKQYIHYEPIMRHLLVRSTKNGTMMNELVIPDLEKESLLVPSESEQKQIGAFFDKLDETITLHQRKLDLLKETKKGFLQKMFV